MKTLLIGMLIFSMLLPSILATDANIYEAQDFTKHPEQMAVLAERDMIRMHWDGKEGDINVRKLYSNSTKVDLTVFIEGAEVPFYATIDNKHSIQLDFDRNNVFDLKVSCFNVIEEGGQKFVALKLEKLETPLITSDVIKENKSLEKYSLIPNYNIIYYLLGGIILICLAVWKRRIVVKAYKKLKNSNKP